MIKTYLIVCAWLCAVLMATSTANAKGYSVVQVPGPTGVQVATRPNAQAQTALAKVGNDVTSTAQVIAKITASASAAVQVTSVITAAASGAAVAGLAGAIGMGGLAALPYILDWLNRANVRPGPNGTIEGADPTTCTVAPCYQYSWDGGRTSSSSASGACKQYADAKNSGHAPGSVYFKYTPTSSNYPYCAGTGVVQNYPDHQYDFNYNENTLGRLEAPPSPTQYVPITETQFRDAMTAASPTAREVQALVDANFPPETAPVSTSGPAKVDAGNTVKLGNDGSRSEESCAFYLEYFPSNIKAHPECVTTTVTPSRTDTKTETTTNPDGSTSTRAITTTVPGTSTTSTTASSEVPDPAAADTALVEVPVLYKAKYPDGMVGVWDAGKAKLASAPLSNLVSALMPNVPNGGSCPSFVLDLNLARWAAFGVRDVAPPCYIWDIGAVIIVLSSLLLARSLVFGG